jgi:hypothetical protein
MAGSGSDADVVAAKCVGCGEDAVLSRRVFEAMQRLPGDKPFICAKCAVDRPGALGGK